MGKFISRTITIGFVLCGICFVTCNFYDATNIEDTPTNEINQNNNMLSMMLETDSGSGQYEMTSLSSWPTDGYVFNSELSKCENGSKLSWDETNKQVVFSGIITDKCYVYFDIISSVALADYVISQYTGTQGENNIYYHDSNLTNGASDNSYRYAGSSADVKNYICLGSSEATCPDDNLYRIIGVFGDNNHGLTGQQLVKVIKNTSIGNIKWNTTASNDWASASLNTTLNSTFKTEKLSGFEDKIANVTWKVSGFNNKSVPAKTVYTGEITNATKTYPAQIGLMYASDYGYATTSDYWTKNLYDYDKANNKDWLFLGSYEWLLSPDSNSSNSTWCVYGGGYVGSSYSVSVTIAVRPSFYLLSSVNYTEGDGTKNSPIRIN